MDNERRAKDTAIANMACVSAMAGGKERTWESQRKQGEERG